MKLTGLQKAREDVFNKTDIRLKLLLMRVNLTCLTILTLALQVQAKDVAAQERVTLHVKGATLESVLESVRKQTGYSYAVQDQYLGAGHRVSVSVDGVLLKEALDDVFRDQPYSYEIVDKIIVVKQKEWDKAESNNKSNGSPPVAVVGVVLSDLGQPLSGASVSIKATGKMTLTNEKGEFKFLGLPPKTVFVVSYIGYLTKEVVFAPDVNLEIRLSRAINLLDQAQVIAYGTTTQRLTTGDVAIVKADDIEKQPVSNPLAALEGRVPGLLITQQTGMPNGAFTVQIRGQNSIAQGNDPLYVVDGVPYASELLPGLNPSGGNTLNFIDPYDIESIEVLKDADATAIYGSRGANGVILITTKKGKIGKTKFDFNVSQGASRVARQLPLLNTQQYLQMRHEAFNNDGVSPGPTDYDLNGVWDTTSYTNWQKVMTGGTATYTSAEASISGGNATTQFLVSGGYHRETTVFPSQYSDQKGSVHLTLTNISPDQKFKMTISGNYVVDHSNLPSTDLTAVYTELAPDAPAIYNPDGSLNWAYDSAGISTWSNPYASLLPKYVATSNNLYSNANLSYQLFSGFQLVASVGYNNMEVKEIQTNPLASINPSYGITATHSNFTDNTIATWNVEPQAIYKRQLGAGKLEALLGTTILQTSVTGQNLTANGISSDALLSSLQAATSITSANVNSIYKYNALFTRLNYDFRDELLLNVTARRDGSSRFGPANRFANFGAVGAGWIFTKEPFIQNNLPGLSFGKLRASYGITGNDQIPDYQYLDLYSGTYLPYQSIQGLYPSNLFNPSLQWEINKKKEGGVEVGLFKDRILFSVSYFLNRSSNQLVSYALPGVTGFTSIQSNLPAVVQNKGWEVTMNATIIKSKDFSWTANFNLTIHRNKLVAYPNFATSPYQYQYVVGKPLSALKLFHSLGVNDTTGLYQFADSKGAATYNPSYTTDNNIVIDMAPQSYGGLQNTFVYKGFQLTLFIHFVKQTGRNYDYQYSLVQPGYFGFNELKDVLNNWQTPGNVKPFQLFGEGFNQVYTAYSYVGTSDLGYADASFVRLKNVSVSYTIPAKARSFTHFGDCRVYIQGQNLLTITNHYKGLDPETQNVFSLPVLRVITAGLQIGF